VPDQLETYRKKRDFRRTSEPKGGWLEGKKLKGGYALTRIRRGKPDAWLLVKMDDEEADPKRDPVRDEPASVRSGRTIEEIAAQR
jgi:hypothetical protein